MGRRSWTIRSLLICFLINGALIAFLLGAGNIIGEAALPVLIAGGAILTLILWVLIFFAGRALMHEGAPATGASPAPSPAPALPEGGVQILAALQREGRLIDFLQEDLSAYEDSQIGAAVRSIHAGCKEALKGQMAIKSIFEQPEGAAVTVPPGFDARAIRLTGNVTGNPPFQGILRHRGWQAEDLRPSRGSEEKDRWILAPAEVEVE